jgi:ribosome-binding factor A
MSTRTEKVSDLMKDEISRLILREMRDPRIGFVTVTGTAVSPDLRLVKVHVSVLGSPEVRQVSLKALNNASAFFRRSLFKNLRLRHAPEVVFRLDESLDQGERIDEVLRAIHADEAARAADEEE